MDSGYDIASATENEREWAAQLMARSSPWIALGTTLEGCRSVCHDPEYLLYVAPEGGSALGAIVLQRRGVASSPYVKSIVVDLVVRGRGVGKAVVAFAENLFRDEARFLLLCVSSFNERARLFYERQGYRTVAELCISCRKGNSTFFRARG